MGGGWVSPSRAAAHEARESLAIRESFFAFGLHWLVESIKLNQWRFGVISQAKVVRDSFNLGDTLVNDVRLLGV